MRLLIIIFLIGASGLAISQSFQIDSLKRLIAKESNAQSKLKALNKLSTVLIGFDAAAADQTTNEAIQLAREIKDKVSEGWALANRGNFLLFTGLSNEAASYLLKSLSIAQSSADQNLQSFALTLLGNAALYRGSFDSASLLYQSAEKILAKYKDGQARYVAFNKYMTGNYFLAIHEVDSAEIRISEGLSVMETLHDSIGIAKGWLLTGDYLRGNDDFVTAEKYYQKAASVARRDKQLNAAYLNGMGEINFRKGDFKQALRNWSTVLAYYRVVQDKYHLAELLLRMGTAFQEQGYYGLSTDYLLQATAIAEAASYKILIARILHQQSWVNFFTRELPLSLKNSFKAERYFRGRHTQLELAGCWDLQGLTYRQLKMYDSALFNHKRSLALRQKMGNKVDISAGFFNLGEYFLLSGKFSEAFPYYQQSLQIDQFIKDNYGVSLNCNRIGKIYTQLGKLDSAKIYLERSRDLAIPTSALTIVRDNYHDYGDYLIKVGKPLEAIEYYKKYTQIADSLFSLQTAESLTSYRTLYDVERGESEIALLNKDNQLNKAVVEKQRIFLMVGIVGFIMLAVLALFYFRFNRKLRKLNFSLLERNEEVLTQSEELSEANQALSNLNRDILEQKEEIQAQAEELTVSNQAILDINQTLETRIDERTSELKQAYKELDTFFYRSSHDFRRPLTTFMGLAEVAKITIKDPQALGLFEKVNTTAKGLDRMLTKLQSISDVGATQLIFKEIYFDEILNTVSDSLRDDIKAKDIRVETSIQVTTSFMSYPGLIKIIFENLIENSITFSNPHQTINLTAHSTEEGVEIMIKDYGYGIEPIYLDKVFDMYFRAHEQSKGNGLGLYIVKRVVEKLNGRISLTSEIGVGTTVKIFLPTLQPGRDL